MDDHTGTLWRHADFMKLWTGQIVSLFGTALTGLALPLIAAVSLKATPAQMGILAAAGSMPSLVVGLFAGVWVDRYRRKALMIASDIGRALLLAIIPISALAGVLTISHLYGIGFLVGVFNVFSEVASRTYLPTVINRSQLLEANSKLEISSSITAVAGPGLAGLIIQAITAPLAIALDGLSYLISALFISLIRRQEAEPQATQSSTLSQVRQGLAVVLGNPLLRPFAGCMATSNFTSSVFFALYILFGTRELGMNAAQLGLIYGIGASGALLAAMLAPWAAKRYGIGRVILAGAILGSLEVVPAVFATPRLAVPLLLLSSLSGNFGWVLHNVNQTSLRQAVVPPSLLGRVNATLSFIVAGMLPLGFLAGGALGQLLGLRETIALAALGSLLSFPWIFFSPVRSLTHLPVTEQQ